MGRNLSLRCKGKSLLTLPAMFCLFTSSKLSCQWFEFLLIVKVMGLNLGYLYKSFLLYLKKVTLLQNGFQPIALWEIKQSVALLRSDHWSGKINISDAVSSNLLHQLIKMEHSGIWIQRVPTLRVFCDLEKTVLHETRVSGTVLWSPTNAKSPTCTYIGKKPC